MRKPQIDLEVLKKRRKKIGEKMKDQALILLSSPETIRNRDVKFSYRQDSNLYYLTGFEEPQSLLIYRPGYNPETIMFVRPKDKELEIWNGFRYGPEGVEKEFGIDKAYPISEFESVAVELLKPFQQILYRLNQNREYDQKIFSILETLKGPRTGKGIATIIDSSIILGESRLIKSEYEQKLMQIAANITVQAHLDAMKFVKPNVNEREVLGVLLRSFYTQKASRESYPSIIASGINATTLHYEFNDQDCKDGDLILIDAGAEYKYYASDVTRTFPVNGKFSEPQAELYQKVLQVQKEVISTIRPGRSFEELQESAVLGLTEALLELGLLTGNREKLIESLEYKKYYPHGVSHWLGSDVHDVGLYKVGEQSRRLEPGMTFTIEPGIYIPIDDPSAPSAYRGIGIRIEDDILVTEGGFQTLTEKLPKEIDEIEKWCRN